MDAEKKSRLDTARHLRGQSLQWRKWQALKANWDHDHCAACWAKFAAVDVPEILHEGYTTCDDYKFGAGYHWICETCYNDLKDELQWRTAP